MSQQPQQPPQPPQLSDSKIMLGCLGTIAGLILIVVLLFSGCSALMSDDDDYLDDDYDTELYDDSDSGEDEFKDAVDKLQEEIDQEEMYGDPYSDLDN